MNGELKRLRDVERWIGWIRLAGVPFAVFQVSIGSGYPHNYRLWAGITTALFAVLIVGWLVLRLVGQTEVAETRAGEAERLRDQLGRRADVLEAANRCARALSSSLELEQAFDSFIREVRGLLPFDRIAIVLSEAGTA
ncbi:MAG: hypothetical protein M3R39_04380, partial [Actinomycetota bacterium]|nr:hypothetical protein [Actinomycetota bacterium]